ncbi:MAG: carbohydrate binding domain-containing protein [Planctomycetota bacterium]
MKKTILLVLVLTLGLASDIAIADYIFGEPVNLGPIVNSSAGDSSPTISADGLELYFGSSRPGGSGGGDIWVSTRATTDDDWGQPVNLGPIVNGPASEGAPSISADGLELYFSDWGDPRPGGVGETDLWVTTRLTKDGEWGEPMNLTTVNSSAYEVTPEISSDGLELYFESDRPGGLGLDDLYVCTRATTEDEWGSPVWLGPTINSSLWEHCPSISADGLTLFFDLDIPGDLMVTKRTTKDDDWGVPVNLGHSASNHWASDISTDGSTLFFASKQDGGSGGNDIWQVPIIPIVDLNSDGVVDSADMCIIVDHWGTDEPLCDIGPTPFGDGIVDVEDLIVLTEHLFEEFPVVEINNLLANGGFEDGVLEPWNTFASSTLINSWSREVVQELVDAAVPEDPIEGDFALHIVVDPTASADFWNSGLQHKKTGHVFEAGKKYTVSAFLKCKQGTLDINFKPELIGPPWTGYGNQIFTMTEEWAEYSITTPVFTEDVGPVSITFHTAFPSTDFWIDGVRLYEGDYVAP